MLVPRPILKTAASSPVAAAAATPVEGMSLDLPADGQQQQQQQYSPGTLDGGMSQEYSSSGIQQQLGRSKLISHPLLLPYSSSNFTSSSRQNSVISLQHSQVDVKSQTSLDHISLHTDEDTHVSLHAYDDYDVSLHTESATVEAVAVGEVQDLGDGTYSCSYTHTVAGLFELHITNGKLVKAVRAQQFNQAMSICNALFVVQVLQTVWWKLILHRWQSRLSVRAFRTCCDAEPGHSHAYIFKAKKNRRVM